MGRNESGFSDSSGKGERRFTEYSHCLSLRDEMVLMLRVLG